LLEARRNDRLATLRAISKINDLTWFLVQKRGKKKVALSYFFFAIVAILSPSTTVNTTHPVAHHNAKST
jgi:hypothetical protein